MSIQQHPADLSAVQTFPFAERPVKVQQAHFAPKGSSSILDSFPHILKAAEFREIVDTIVTAHQKKKPILVGFGGHVIKCGLAPLLIHLMEQGIITAVMMNGGASIHDFEIAMFGQTSEDVAASLPHGRFGMVEETGRIMNDAIRSGAQQGQGQGASLGQKLLDLQALNNEHSILATAVRLALPIMVFSVIGGDTIHQHPHADGAALGQTYFYDFRLLISQLQQFGNGGVYLNIGSAVVLPEVFLKALNTARNISEPGTITNFTTINMDMKEQYRPLQNVVQRPTQGGTGKGYNLIGHHELMIPLLTHAILTQLKDRCISHSER